MRPTTVVMMIVLVGLLAASAVSAARPRHKVSPECPPANEGVVVADAQAVVYKAATIVYEPEERKFVEGNEGIFGCAYGARRAYHFGPTSYGSGTSGSGGTYPIVLAGPVVAYDVGESSSSPLPDAPSRDEIWVRNLRTGKMIHRMPNGSPAKPGDIGLGETTAIVVKNDGSVAWIVRASERLGGIQVRSVDKAGGHVLAMSPEIDPTSLALAGSTLYWLQSGKPMSAVLN